MNWREHEPFQLLFLLHFGVPHLSVERQALQIGDEREVKEVLLDLQDVDLPFECLLSIAKQK